MKPMQKMLDEPLRGMVTLRVLGNKSRLVTDRQVIKRDLDTSTIF